MNLTHREADIVFAIMHELAGCRNKATLRHRVGGLMLALLDAQYLASYEWDEETGRFDDCIYFNMDRANLARYEEYYQYHDPITPVLQKRRRATAVSEIISRPRLEKTEFFNDFLARDGLHYGMNYFAYSAGRNIGDLRIWRSRRGEDFTRRDTEIMDAVGAAFTRSLLNCGRRERLAARGDADIALAVEEAGERRGLTPREKEIAAAVMRGQSDRAICEELCISLPTVRTHLQAIYRKFEVKSRSQLVRAIGFE